MWNHSYYKTSFCLKANAEKLTKKNQICCMVSESKIEPIVLSYQGHPGQNSGGS